MRNCSFHVLCKECGSYDVARTTALRNASPKAQHDQKRTRTPHQTTTHGFVSQHASHAESATHEHTQASLRDQQFPRLLGHPFMRALAKQAC